MGPRSPHTPALRAQVPASLSSTLGNRSLREAPGFQLFLPELPGSWQEGATAWATSALPVWLSMVLCVARSGPAPGHTLQFPDDFRALSQQLGMAWENHHPNEQGLPTQAGWNSPWAFALPIPSVRKNLCSVFPMTSPFSFFKSQLKCHRFKEAPPDLGAHCELQEGRGLSFVCVCGRETNDKEVLSPIKSFLLVICMVKIIR